MALRLVCFTQSHTALPRSSWTTFPVLGCGCAGLGFADTPPGMAGFGAPDARAGATVDFPGVPADPAGAVVTFAGAMGWDPAADPWVVFG